MCRECLTLKSTNGNCLCEENTMRKLEQEMITAIRGKGPFANGNTHVLHHNGKVTVTLYSTVIAERDKGKWTFRDGGYETATTYSRIRAISKEFCGVNFTRGECSSPVTVPETRS